jgi:hypothetical protein
VPRAEYLDALFRSGSIRRMKSKQSSASRSVAKKQPPRTVEEYLAATPEPACAMLIKMRAAIRSVLPDEASEIISYKIPAFKLKKIVV